MPLTNSSLFCRLKLMKLVSTRTRYGGTSAVLCARKSEDAAGGTRRTAFSLSSSSFFACFTLFSFRRISFGFSRRLTCANFLVFFAFTFICYLFNSRVSIFLYFIILFILYFFFLIIVFFGTILQAKFFLFNK